jgi:hypothetical protein
MDPLSVKLGLLLAALVIALILDGPPAPPDGCVA